VRDTSYHHIARYATSIQKIIAQTHTHAPGNSVATKLSHAASS
jgi:hypothetical protein